MEKGSVNWIFRGYDAVGEKGWVYGDLVHNVKVTKDADVPRVMVGGYEVVPESVGLCTGMEDKDGNLIWEGDIVEVTCIKEGENLGKFLFAYVGYDGKTAAFCLYYPDGNHAGLMFNNYCDSLFSVVGNVYEDSEILKAN